MASRIFSANVKEENLNNMKHCIFCGNEVKSLHLSFQKLYLVECEYCDKVITFEEIKKSDNPEAEKLYEVIKEAYFELRHPDPEFSTYKACAVLKKVIPERTRNEIVKKDVTNKIYKNVHPLTLLDETKDMDGYEFIDWLETRTDAELKDLSSMAYSLKENVVKEREKRGWEKSLI